MLQQGALSLEYISSQKMLFQIKLNTSKPEERSQDLVPLRVEKSLKHALTGLIGKCFIIIHELVFANDLNRFFCFDTANNLEKYADLNKTITPMSADRIVVTVDKARCIFQRTNSWKSLGPDSSSALVLKSFSRALTLSWQSKTILKSTMIFVQ